MIFSDLIPSDFVLSLVVFFIFSSAILLLMYYAFVYFFDSEGDHLSGNQQESQQRRHRLWKAIIILVFAVILPLEILLWASQNLVWYQSYALLFAYFYVFLFIFIGYSTMRNRASILLYEQLMHALDIFIEHLELGYSLVTCFDKAQQKTKNPIRKFFHSVFIKLDAGQALDVAMVQASYRIKRLSFIQYFIIAMRIHDKTGAPVVNELRYLKQQLFRYKQDIQKQNIAVSLVKVSSLMTSFLPILVMLILFWVYPDFMMPFLMSPISPIIVALCSMVLLAGVYFIFKMTEIKFYQINGEPL